MEDRMRILELIEAGEISVEEGARRLDALTAVEEAEHAEPPASPTRPAFVEILWLVVFCIGGVLLAGGGFLLSKAYTQETASGMAWGWVLFVIGVLVTGLGWWLRDARWFYLRVRERMGRQFTFALPLPLGLFIWLLRIAEPFVPQLQGKDMVALVGAMRDELRDGRSFVLDVDEGKDGERVELYIC